MSDTVKSVKELKSEFDKAKAQIKKAQSVIAGIEFILEAKYAASKKEELNAMDKEAGSITFEEGDIKLKFEIPKKVKWDSNKLGIIGASLAPEIASKIFKVKIEMSEMIFGGLTDADLILKVRDARTVVYGEPKVSFETQD